MLTGCPAISSLSLHDALPISDEPVGPPVLSARSGGGRLRPPRVAGPVRPAAGGHRRVEGRGRTHAGLRSAGPRSEEHTSELQSRANLVCRPLLEKKKSPPPTA